MTIKFIKNGEVVLSFNDNEKVENVIEKLKDINENETVSTMTIDYRDGTKLSDVDQLFSGIQNHCVVAQNIWLKS